MYLIYGCLFISCLSNGGYGCTFKLMMMLLLCMQAKSPKRKRVENGEKILDFDMFLRDVASIGEGLVKSIHVSSARRKDI